MDNRDWIIVALGEVPPPILSHEKFATTARQLITKDMDGPNRAKVIRTLGKIDAKILFGDKFASTFKSLVTDYSKKNTAIM